MSAAWCVIPAAGRGLRFGGELPKQHLEVAGKSVLAHTLDALLSHPRITGAMIALAPGDTRWPPGFDSMHGKPVRVCAGGVSRAASVANALAALPAEVVADAPVLVHDAARPNLAFSDLDALFAALDAHPAGAILAAPVRDTLKRADAAGDILSTEPRESLWRAFTPQAFPRAELSRALAAAAAAGIEATDESMAMTRAGVRVRLVEGREDNFKITTPADLAHFAYLVSQR
ncbi:2-C-methyl-D-erythritol 4-phosphate cytidylyltransferase [Lysobacter pythonis]|uniref:2-C-methyl-D-erythritol 4-phosphate cytidylyltransferase n=1 Tax=Solilutibacter pythonis TaxID=2483112 RepID=A0A3M2HF47_9GAMM|nr:2-C-methyl-D-erythritol 4-phosphate cytidylyltransferase [Lysobacter pythonis]